MKCILIDSVKPVVQNVNAKIQEIASNAIRYFIDQYKVYNNQSLFLAVNWSEGAPYLQEEIDQARASAQNARKEADDHQRNAWEALGNYHPGTVVREALEGWNCLRDSEKFEREAVQMENSNIDYERERK